MPGNPLPAVRQQPPAPCDELPPWATGVRRTAVAKDAQAGPGSEGPDESYGPFSDPQSGLTYLKGLGIVVVVVDGPELGGPAIDLLARLQAHPFDVLAVVLPAEPDPSHELLAALSHRGVEVVRDMDGKPLHRAGWYFQRIMELRAEGQIHLRRFLSRDE